MDRLNINKNCIVCMAIGCLIAFLSACQQLQSPTPEASKPTSTPETFTPTELWYYPPSPTPIPDDWYTYSDPPFGIHFRYPANWKQNSPGRFGGEDGFFEVSGQIYRASLFDSMGTLCLLEANRNKPATYGQYPLVSYWQGRDLEHGTSQVGSGCTVEPSNDYPTTKNDQAILVARHPDNRDQVIILKADILHFRGIIETFRFDKHSTPEPSTSNYDSPACNVIPNPDKPVMHVAEGKTITEYPLVSENCNPWKQFDGFRRRVNSLEANTRKFSSKSQPAAKGLILNYAKEPLFPIGSPSQALVKKGNEIIYSFAVFPFGPAGDPVQGLWGWEGHWVMETHNVIIQDGNILNLDLGYDELFEWTLMLGNPLSLYKKGNIYGILYNNQPLSFQYDDIIHGQLCCDPSFLAAFSSPAGMKFYGLRGGIWYLVTIIPGE